MSPRLLAAVAWRDGLTLVLALVPPPKTSPKPQPGDIRTQDARLGGVGVRSCATSYAGCVK